MKVGDKVIAEGKPATLISEEGALWEVACEDGRVYWVDTDEIEACQGI